MTTTFKGYDLTRRAGGVDVYEPNQFGLPVYTALTVKGAKAWVDAYRVGQQWAVAARRAA